MRVPSAIALTLCLGFGVHDASASIIYIDASAGGSNPIIPYCPGGCLFDYLSPLYSFHTGDTVNFGTLELYSFVLPSRTGDSSTVMGNYEVSFGPIDIFGGPFPTFVSDGSTSVSPVLVSPLIFAFKTDSEFQLAWTAGVNYSPASPVPEPSTWAMLLIGLAAIGFAYRRSAHRIGHC
jgi:hypothetical protein